MRKLQNKPLGDSFCRTCVLHKQQLGIIYLLWKSCTRHSRL